MKKSLWYPIGILIAAAVFYGLHLFIENFSTQVKFGFLSKILLMIGIVGLLLVWLDNSKKGKESI